MNHSDCWYKESCPLKPGGCSDFCIRYSEMLRLVNSANIPECRWFPEKLLAGNYDRDAFIRLAEIKDGIKQFVEDGNNLYLYSAGCGNGKTSWALKLMLAYFNQVWYGNCFRPRGIFINFPEFVERERLSIGGKDEEFLDIKQMLIDVDLVVWDDFSAIKLSDYMLSVLLNILDIRALSKKSNIFTSNIEPTRIADIVGVRIESRILNKCEQVKFRGVDRRLMNNG